jgi:hypothetical protein
LKTALFCHRGKPKYLSHLILFLKNETKNLLSIGSEDSYKTDYTKFNSLIYKAGVGCLALCKTIQTESPQKKFLLKKLHYCADIKEAPKLGYLFQNTSLDVFMSCKTKKPGLVI